MSLLAVEQPRPRAQTQPTSSLWPDLLFATVALLPVLLVLWLQQGIDSLLTDRSRDLITRAVLKPDITEDSAMKLVDQIRTQASGLRITVVSPEQARTRLALQEGWMRKLPEMEIGRLPYVLEIWHPATLHSPDIVYTFNERLQQYPAVDFVIFNGNGYDGFIEFAGNIRWFGRMVLGMISVLMTMLWLLYASRGRHRTRESIARTRVSAHAFRAAALALIAGAIAWTVLLAIRTIAARHYAFPTLPVASTMIPTAITATLFFVLPRPPARPAPSPEDTND